MGPSPSTKFELGVIKAGRWIMVVGLVWAIVGFGKIAFEATNDTFEFEDAQTLVAGGAVTGIGFLLRAVGVGLNRINGKHSAKFFGF